MTSLLVVGESLVDVTATPGGTTTWPGGSPLNIAVGCARLGVQTVLASQIGDDDAGELIRDHLDQADIDVRSLPPHRGESSVARAMIDAAGLATYEFDLTWDPSELPPPADFECIHVGSIGATLMPGADAVAALAADATAAGVPVTFDPNVRPSITPDLDGVRDRVAGLAGLATVIKLSDEDAGLLYPDTSDVLDMLVGTGRTRLAVMTCGGRSVLLQSGTARVEVEPPTVDVVDTIGAGDSFMSALIWALTERNRLGGDDLDANELAELGAIAAQAAAITCTRAGADPPTRSELEIPPIGGVDTGTGHPRPSGQAEEGGAPGKGACVD